MRQLISSRFLYRYFAALIVSVLSFSAISAEEQKILAQVPALRDRPSLSISVYQLQRSVTASFDIDIVLTNLTDKAFDVDSISIFLPESLKSIRENLQEKLDIQKHEISAGTERIYRVGIRSVNNLYSAVLNMETFFFTPGTYVIKAEAVLKESKPDESAQLQYLYATYELTLQPPLSAVLRGGVLGALLLALFVPAYRALYAKYERSIQWKELFIQFVIFFVAGSIISVTTILLLHRLGSANLPITVATNDYLGGMIVGLFSYTVGNALYQQFFGKDHSFDLTKGEKSKELPPPA